MKKLLLVVALFVATISNAQKNSVLLGGNVGFQSEKIGDAKATDFDFSPKVGYQFTDNWTIGVEGSIANVKVDGFGKTEKYKIGGFTRYSLPLSETFAFYTDLGAGYQSSSVNDAKGMYVSLTPALFINVKRGFGLNFSIGGVNYDNLDGKNDPRQERFGFNFGKTLNIGISKNFQL
ncbi:outer membrane protein with beta-barrel domain [Flavobacterium sp. 270]|uniref:outer membrane beta-barrel protein n=1 Tax=Flavobacterium sp. 270 TaxID=2512114 RepID=UPI00106496AF|nr:outer membrane beta-barrel protein [Flavobacterium sp. 270]TDW47048.1 outer membrane protein with beta-barrel domain [Flavobacterium sp. 270]